MFIYRSFFQKASSFMLFPSPDPSMSGNSSNFTILDPLNLSNNTTKNSYLTKDIL